MALDHGKLLAREAPFKELVAFHPAVPQLQRNYSWTSNEWNDLWSDLNDFYDDYGSSDRPYFIGTVVLQKEGAGVEILDGQQRLATLTILLNALCIRLRELDKEAAFFYENGGLRDRQGPSKYIPYLTLNQYDGPYFRSFVIDRKVDQKPKFDSHKLISKAQAFFDQRIEEHFAENPELDERAWLDAMCSMILNRIMFVYVLADASDTHQVFRVLNDRGRSLSQLDLFRTFLLQKAQPENRDEIASSWSQVFGYPVSGKRTGLIAVLLDDQERRR